MMLKFKAWKWKAALLLAGFLLICVGGAYALLERRYSDEVITIAQFGDLLLYMPLYIAADGGLFAREGLDVRIVSTGGDEKTYAAVLSGSAKFGVADPTFVAIAAQRGQSGKVLALLVNGVPNYGVSLHSGPSHFVKEPVDLAGKTVATPPAPSTAYALVRALFERGKLEPEILQVAPAGLVSSLEAGQADYAVLIEPWVSGVTRRGGMIAFSLMDYYPNFALTGLTTSDDVISEQPDVAEAVVRSLGEAVHLFYTDPALTLDVASRRFKGEKLEDLEAGLARMREDRIYPSNLIMTQEAWAPAIELRQNIGDLLGGAGPMSAYVDTAIAESAAASRER